MSIEEPTQAELDEVFKGQREHDACGVGTEVDLNALARQRYGVDPETMDTSEVMDSGLDSFYCNQHRIGVLPDGTGDGAGISTNIPTEYYNNVIIEEFGPEARKKDAAGNPVRYKKGEFGIAQLFLPKNITELDGETFEALIAKIIGEDPRFKLLGLRDTPTDPSKLTDRARDTMPRMKQAFFSFADGLTAKEKNKLCVELHSKIDTYFKKHNETVGRQERDRVTVVSCSNRMITWKGMLNTNEIPFFYKEMRHPIYKKGVTVIKYHGRMSTNSTPEWAYAHPNGTEGQISHNGELNTIGGNRKARRVYNKEVKGRVEVINADLGSDSRHFAAHVSELSAEGISTAEAVVKLLPPAYEQDPNLSEEAKAMLKYNSMTHLPYTGPAHIVFCDGDQYGAMLDPSGLRPSRYVVTIKKITEGDDLGVRIANDNRKLGWPYDEVPEGWQVSKLRIGSEDTYNDKKLAEQGEFVIARGSLGAGDMLLHDADGKFYRGREYIEKMADPARNGGHDYKAALKEMIRTLPKAEYTTYAPKKAQLDLYTRMQALLWHQENINIVLAPMIKDGKLGITAMGDDGQLLRKHLPTHMADYFKELFAQITNPALDFIREPESFSFKGIIGPNASLHYKMEDGKLVKTSGASGDLFFEYDDPFLMDNQIDEIKKKLPTQVIDITFDVDSDNPTASMHQYKQAMERVLVEAEAAAREGRTIILSDRNISSSRQALSDLQAVAAVNKHLIKSGCRASTNIIVESGQAKDPHHACALFAYGASAVNTYLVHELIKQMHVEKPASMKKMELKDMLGAYHKACVQAYGKTMAKMGVSNHIDYVGAELMEARAVDNKSFGGAFAGTYSPTAGLNEDDFAFAHVAAHHLGMTRLKDFKGLENVFKAVLKASGIATLNRQEGKKLYGIFAQNADELKAVLVAENGRQRERIRLVFTRIIAIYTGAADIEDETERGAAFEKINAAIKSELETRHDQIIEVITNTQKPVDNLLTYGIYGMRKGGVPHRFGPELVSASQLMYKKHEIEREKEIAALMEAKKQETENPDELAAYEEHLRKFALYPRDENGRILVEFIQAYREPSKAYEDFVAKAVELATLHRYSDRDYVSIVPDTDRAALSDADMELDPYQIIREMTRVGQMSKGALTPKAWETIALAEHNIGGNASTGEGGEDPRKLATSISPLNKQIASGRFGITAEMLRSCIDQNGVIQIKIVQGAKPGEGGELPEGKVLQWVATLRQSTPGVYLPSPAPMHDLYSIEDLQGLIFELKSFCITDEHGNRIPIKVDVKIGATESTEIVGLGAAKAGADIITIAGHEGGTGAAPSLSARHTGQDWLVEGARLDECLRKNGLREHVKMVAEGGVSNHMDMLLALKYFDGVGQGTFEMIANKCIMARVCNAAGISAKKIENFKKTFKSQTGLVFEELPLKDMLELVKDKFCPTGVANSEALFKPEPWRIEQYKMDVAAGLYKWLKDHGYKNLEEFRNANNVSVSQPKDVHRGPNGEQTVFGTFDYSCMVRPRDQIIAREKHDRNKGIHTLDRMDDQWMNQLNDWLSAIEIGETPPPIVVEMDTSPYDRAVGGRTSSQICLKVHDGRIEMEAYPERKIVGATDVAHIKLSGNAGQAFGFALAHGILLKANIAQDGIGKSGGGGKIVIAPEIPEGHPCPETYLKNCVVGGNAVGYGNQGTYIFAAGQLGTRAAVCMKGGAIVCEGCKDFGAEFMTNGTFISLGEVGNFFGNEQSGGLSIIYDPQRAAFRKLQQQSDDPTKLVDFSSQYARNVSKKHLREMNNDEGQLAIQVALKKMLEEHLEQTGSAKAKHILDNWEVEKDNFTYLIPRTYDRFMAQEAVDVMNAVDRDRKTPLSPGEAATRINMQLQTIRAAIKEAETLAWHLDVAGRLLAQEGPMARIYSIGDSMVDSQLKGYLGDKESMSIEEVIEAIELAISSVQRPGYAELMETRRQLERNNKLEIAA